MKLLVSVRSVDEALLAAEHGADLIDCKEPHAGALGALPPATLRDIVATLRRRFPGKPISATVGDFAADAIEPVMARVAQTAGCGVDYVKVGVLPGAHALLERLAAHPAAIVPVFIADAGIDWRLVERAWCASFAALMLDTADKAAGSLFDAVDAAALQRFVGGTQEARAQSGLAGALQVAHLPRLARLAPGFAGFRSAVCDSARTGALSESRMRALREAVAG